MGTLIMLSAAVAAAGNVYLEDVFEDHVWFDALHATDESGTIVTWPGRPLDVLIVADLSLSIVGNDGGASWSMSDAMVEAASTMKRTYVQGDRLGVTAFGERAQRWIPLGAIDRPGLRDWLEAFGPADGVLRITDLCDPNAAPRAWSAIVDFPSSCVGQGTDVRVALDAAYRDLADRRRTSLAVVILVWDGGAEPTPAVRRLLDRMRAAEIHVFTVAVGHVTPSQLFARGGGDIYWTVDRPDAAVRQIIEGVRFPEM